MEHGKAGFVDAPADEPLTQREPFPPPPLHRPVPSTSSFDVLVVPPVINCDQAVLSNWALRTLKETFTANDKRPPQLFPSPKIASLVSAPSRPVCTLTRFSSRPSSGSIDKLRCAVLQDDRRNKAEGLCLEHQPSSNDEDAL
ncbi:hypothetical protein RTBOTA2_004346 [Rhodotorula toruloides]|nr:hypothetical protein RTBOTA2_004346 [Rhodotorula toruloides]